MKGKGIEKSKEREIHMIIDIQKEETTVSGMISIIMPAYNAQRTLHRAVDSALCQTYQNIELLIIDDFSIDSTAQIAEEYIKQDRRVRLLKNDKNLGAAASRNRGVDAARGEWIAFLTAMMRGQRTSWRNS